MEENGFADKNKFTEDILKMLERGSANDVKIKLSDGEISANKDILVARSEYFATMLSNNKFVEGETSSVDMSHCSKVVMEKILKFLFSGEVTFDHLSFTHLLELTHMTEMMILTEFKAKVENFVIREIENNEETALLVPKLVEPLRLSYQYNCKKINQSIINELHYAMKVIPEDVKASDSFKTLPFDLIKDIFLCDPNLYENGTYTEAHSLDKLKSFVVWLSENEVTEEQKKKIVDSVDIEEFTVKELLTLVRDSGLYSVKKIDERVLYLFKVQEETIENLMRRL